MFGLAKYDGEQDSSSFWDLPDTRLAIQVCGFFYLEGFGGALIPRMCEDLCRWSSLAASRKSDRFWGSEIPACEVYGMA